MTPPTPPHRPRTRRPGGRRPGRRKYGTTNPVVARLLDRWMAEIRARIGSVAGTVVDVGVGEGLALERMIPGGHPTVGLEYRIDKAAVAGPAGRLAPVVADAGMLPFPDGCADLVTCIEVLEHLPTDHPAVRAGPDHPGPLRGVGAVGAVVPAGQPGPGQEPRAPGQRSRARAVLHPQAARRPRAAFPDVSLHPAFPWLIAEAGAPAADPVGFDDGPDSGKRRSDPAKRPDASRGDRVARGHRIGMRSLGSERPAATPPPYRRPRPRRARLMTFASNGSSCGTSRTGTSRARASPRRAWRGGGQAGRRQRRASRSSASRLRARRLR